MKFHLAKIIVIIFVLLPQTGCNDLISLKPYKMAASSMQPIIKKGDRILVNLSFYKNNRPKRGDIVVFRFPKDPKKQWIKRIVAFGGETIEIKDGAILINGKILGQNNIKKHLYTNAGEYGSEGKAILIPENHFFVLGDYSEKSFDSRYWGFLPEENLVAKATKIYWPLNRFGNIE